MSRPMTPEEKERGWVVCDCLKYAWVFRSALLKYFPEGEKGECCAECLQYVCHLPKLFQAVAAEERAKREGEEESSSTT